MDLSSKARVFARKRGYAIRELCTGRVELKKEFELMEVKAIVEKGAGEAEVSCNPKIIPLLAASAVLFAAFFPLVAGVYLFYAFMSNIRVNSIKKDFKDMKW